MADDLPDLGDLERDVMQLVWAHAPLTAEDVRKRLGRRLRESTIRTVLTRLEDKGFVTHTTEGRTFVYSAAEARPRVAARAAKRIVDWFCQGSVEEMLVGMVDTAMIDPKKLQALLKKVEAAKKGRK
jgi:BlaI family penicillinase repressor